MQIGDDEKIFLWPKQRAGGIRDKINVKNTELSARWPRSQHIFPHP